LNSHLTEETRIRIAVTYEDALAIQRGRGVQSVDILAVRFDQPMTAHWIRQGIIQSPDQVIVIERPGDFSSRFGIVVEVRVFEDHRSGQILSLSV
jgi:hypothetical protein